MTLAASRLPQGIECLNQGSLIAVSGALGVVTFKSCSKAVRKGDIALFLPPLPPYQSSLFMQAVLGVVSGYVIRLKMVGIGYFGQFKDGQLTLMLGYSLPVVLTPPRDVSVAIKKKEISLRSPNFALLQDFATTVRSYRYPDSYKGGGVRYDGEVVVLKEGKKS